MTPLFTQRLQIDPSTPDKTAVVDRGRRVTYGELQHSVQNVSAALLSRWEVPFGSVVGLFAPNCVEFVIAYFALLQIGAVVQPLDERYTSEELKAALEDSGVKYLIVHSSLVPKLATLHTELPKLKEVLGIGFRPEAGDRFEDWMEGLARPGPLRPAGYGDLAELMYTSGTTGEPKGVMRSHGNVLAAARNSIVGFGYRPDDIILIVMPLSHSSALNSQMIPLLLLGGTVVLLNGFDPHRLLSILRQERATCMRVVPAMLRMLLTLPEFHWRALPNLRLLINSSAPVDPEAYREVKRRFANVEVLNSYGLTEASTCTVLPDRLALSHAESIGHPIEGVEMSVRGEKEEVLGSGEPGEIYVRGEHVFVGYYNRPDATRSALDHGWLRTGDFGHRDGDGLYYLHGRRSNLINCGGRKFAPMEVENCISRLPGVVEVAVAATPHRTLGEVAKAFVVVSKPDEIDAKHIVGHCARNLPSHKVPFSVVFVQQLPKSGAGKVLYRQLQEV